ncbi:MAG: hypothetical protein IKQ58_08400 [Prevotella sp.]|nr:hypothetical protein [Prevotella sp.]
MKISKFTTKDGACGRPVTTELETIIERMRSEKNREAVELISAGVLGWRRRAVCAARCGSRS